MKGKSHSEKSKKLNREKHLGKKHSNESKEKIGDASKGKNNPMFGKSFMDIWIEKYGEKEANIKYTNWKEKLKKRKI